MAHLLAGFWHYLQSASQLSCVFVCMCVCAYVLKPEGGQQLITSIRINLLINPSNINRREREGGGGVGAKECW